MPAANLTVTNISPVSVTIQTIGIASGATYTVPFANLVAWAKDPFLRAYVLGGQAYITALGTVLRLNAADQFLTNIVLGNVVYAS